MARIQTRLFRRITSSAADDVDAALTEVVTDVNAFLATLTATAPRDVSYTVVNVFQYTGQATTSHVLQVLTMGMVAFREE